MMEFQKLCTFFYSSWRKANLKEFIYRGYRNKDLPPDIVILCQTFSHGVRVNIPATKSFTVQYRIHRETLV